MKYLAIALMAICLNAFAFDPDKELQGSNVLSSGPCSEGGQALCFLLANTGKFYIAAVDLGGLLAVFLVKEPKDSYSVDEMKLVWKRRQPVKGERSVSAPEGGHPQMRWG